MVCFYILISLIILAQGIAIGKWGQPEGKYGWGTVISGALTAFLAWGIHQGW